MVVDAHSDGLVLRSNLLKDARVSHSVDVDVTITTAGIGGVTLLELLRLSNAPGDGMEAYETGLAGKPTQMLCIGTSTLSVSNSNVKQIAVAFVSLHLRSGF